MAFQTNTELKTGVVVTYWEIKEVNINYFNSTARIAVAGYVDGIKKGEGKIPVETQTFYFENDTFPFKPDAGAIDIQKIAYQALQTQPDFQAATPIDDVPAPAAQDILNLER